MNRRIAKKIAATPMPPTGPALDRWNMARRWVGLLAFVHIDQPVKFVGFRIYAATGGMRSTMTARRFRRLSPKRRRAVERYFGNTTLPKWMTP